MYEAYTNEEIVFKLPIEASSITCYASKEKLFIGSRQGHLITCNQAVEVQGTSKHHYEYQVCRTFERRPIVELQVFTMPLNLTRLYTSSQNIRRFRHFLTFWSRTKFCELCEVDTFVPINLQENAQVIVWCEPNILILAVKGACQFWNIELLHKNEFIDEKDFEPAKRPRLLELIRTGSSESAPLVVFLLKKTIVGICREGSVVDFYEPKTGKITNDFSSCKFSDQVLSLVYHHPYLVGILPKNLLEVRFQYYVWAAEEPSMPPMKKQFELAAQLSASSTQQIAIQRQLATKYFFERKFSKCFEIHTELKTDVLLVLNLFPFFIPEKYVAVLTRYPQAELQTFEVSLENIAENERKFATQALIQYLVARRAEQIALVNQHYLDYNSGNKARTLCTNELKRHEASLELIDTVLLKCYIKANPSMAKSLLRTKNCCCIVSEAEKDLNQYGLFEELLILYEKKKMYRKYLELLQREVKKHESFGIKDIANFLRRLKRDQISLVLEFSAPILFESVELGVQIFTSSTDDRETDLKQRAENDPRVKFDREMVLQFLKKECVQAVIPYLEHVIYKWNDERPRFHEELLEQYVMQKIDPYYSVENASNLIGDDENLMEESAIIMGRLGQHLDVLKIYTEILMDFNGAERHCQTYYDEKNASTHNEKRIETELRRKPNITEALKLFKRHPTKINTVGAFAIIPPSTLFNRICEALKALFETSNNQLASTNLIVSLTNLLIQRNKKRLKELKRQRISITESAECSLCKKRIMNSAFIRNRDHSFSHFFCYKNRMEKNERKEESDGFITPTVLEQRRVEEIVVKQKREWTRTHGMHLQNKSHVDYILACLEGLPKSYSGMDASRSWFCYWGLHALRLLGHKPGKALQNGIVSFLASCQTEDGGYGGGPGQMAHLATTYASVMSLITIGTDEALSSINLKTLNFFIHSMRQPNGSFTIHKGGESDVRAVYCALAVANICGLPVQDQLFEETASWLTRCQTYEGGFGGEPNCEAHSGYTFCGLAGLALLRKLHLVNIDAALKWLVNRQMTFEGGFQGRANKLVDVLCAGGVPSAFRRNPDLYHTCYTLSGLSTSQFYSSTKDEVLGGKRNIVETVHPIYNIHIDAYARALRYFES
uniref:Protein farnesyltransferase n=1 Tax=Globodera rostochiensis TaxID=31243 RepID=A0A914GUY8_GLORO